MSASGPSAEQHEDDAAAGRTAPAHRAGRSRRTRHVAATSGSPTVRSRGGRCQTVAPVALAALEQLTHATGVAAGLGAWRRATQRQASWPSDASFEGAVSLLLRTGRVAVSGGGPWHEYAPTGAQTLPKFDGGFLHLVRDVLRRECARRRRMLSTSEVMRAVRRRASELGSVPHGGPDDASAQAGESQPRRSTIVAMRAAAATAANWTAQQFAVRVRDALTSLTRAHRSGPRAWRQPQATCESRLMDGQSTRRAWFWKPITLDVPAPETPGSRCDAIRTAVARTEAALGLPVTLVNVYAWRDAHRAADPVAAYLVRKSMAVYLADACARDAHAHARPDEDEGATPSTPTPPMAKSPAATEQRARAASQPQGQPATLVHRVPGVRGVPDRYTARPTHDDTQRGAIPAARLLDLVTHYRIGEEIDGVAACAQRGAARGDADRSGRAGSPSFGSVAALRTGLVDELLRAVLDPRAVGESGHGGARDEPIPAIIARCLTALAVYVEWAHQQATGGHARSAGSERPRAAQPSRAAIRYAHFRALAVAKRLEDATRALATVEAYLGRRPVARGPAPLANAARLLQAPPPGSSLVAGAMAHAAAEVSADVTADVTTIAMVGEAALVTHEAGRRVAREVSILLGGSAHGGDSMIDRVRRVPAPADFRAGRRSPAEVTALDRPDLVATLIASAALPRAAAHLAPAEALLGHVLRDADALRRLLDAAPAADGSGRRALVVALALLGQGTPAEQAVPDPTDAQDTATACCAALLTHLFDDATTRAAAMTTDIAAIERRSRGAARITAARALRYLRAPDGPRWLDALG